MQLPDYENIIKTGPAIISLGGESRVVTLNPFFVGKRLFSLELEVDKPRQNDLTSMISDFTKRFGDPASKNISERMDTLALDRRTPGKFPVRETIVTWQFSKYDVTIAHVNMETKTGKWEEKLSVIFSGNNSFYGILRSISEREE
jgi:hypothetical protein